jgi:glycine cleavage system H protein
MWCKATDDGYRFGFTAYAVRLMQDVYFLEWSVDAGAAVAARQPIGFLESSKAQSELYAPLAGTVLRFNPSLLNDPSAINVDGYNAGWLFDLSGDPVGTLDVHEYRDFLTAGWEHTQRLLKKQVHETEDE